MLKSAIRPKGQVLILDSAWSDARALTRKKEGPQKRSLADGREYLIYKKYIDENDLSSMVATHGIGLTIEHFGKVFFAARGAIEKGQ